MSDERELIAEREKKVEEIRALGANPYANGFTPTHTAAGVTSVTIAPVLTSTPSRISESSAASLNLAGNAASR